jgi:Leucine rich repeat
MKTAIVLSLLFSAITAIHINCAIKFVTISGQFKDSCTCFVTSITSMENRSLESVNGTVRDGERNSDVKLVYFAQNTETLTFIPQNIHKFFPNLVGIAFVESCNIDALTGDELKDYVNLEWFFLTYNPIKKIPGNLFENNKKLKGVDLRLNNITHVGAGLLSGLDHLNTVFFEGNDCIDENVVLNRAAIGKFIENLRDKCPDV